MRLTFDQVQRVVAIPTVLSLLLMTTSAASYGVPVAPAALAGQQSGSATTQCEQRLRERSRQLPADPYDVDATGRWWAERDQEAQATLPICKQAAQASPTPRNHFLYGQALLNATRTDPQDFLGALKQFTLAANAGYAPAMTSIGRMYMFGEVGRRDRNADNAQAVAWFRKAAKAGDGEAMDLLGALYEGGNYGLPQSDEQAEFWYRKAADAGYAPAVKVLELRFSPVAAGPRSSKEVARQAAAWDRQVAQWYRIAADKGDVSAMVEVGSIYERGKGVPVSFANALTWYRKAAASGSVVGMVHLGSLYESGRGVPKNYQEALSLYRKAAALGGIDRVGLAITSGGGLAMIRLGLMYEMGRGVPQDYKQAASWFRKGRSSDWAYLNLGVLYQNGWGVPRDLCKAREMYKGAWLGSAGKNNDLSHAAYVLYKKTPDCPASESLPQMSKGEAVAIGAIVFLAFLALSADQSEGPSGAISPDSSLNRIERENRNMCIQAGLSGDAAISRMAGCL